MLLPPRSGTVANCGMFKHHDSKTKRLHRLHVQYLYNPIYVGSYFVRPYLTHCCLIQGCCSAERAIAKEFLHLVSGIPGGFYRLCTRSSQCPFSAIRLTAKPEKAYKTMSPTPEMRSPNYTKLASVAIPASKHHPCTAECCKL